MKYFIVAVNNSEDIQAARLAKEIRRNDVRAVIVGIGGSQMVSEEVMILETNTEFPFSRILTEDKLLKSHIQFHAPDVVIVLNTRCFYLLRFAKKLGFKTCYYSNPHVLKHTNQNLDTRYVDKVLTTLPLEEKSYKRESLDVEYVGCPMVDFVKDYRYDSQFQVNPNKMTIAVLPGEGIAEIELSLALIQNLIKIVPEYCFLIAGSSQIRPEFYKEFKGISNTGIFFDNAYDLVKRSNAAIVMSSVVSLETALLNCPQVFVYKQNLLSLFASKISGKMKWKSLVNIVSRKEVIKEVVYDKNETSPILNELKAMITDHNYCAGMMHGYQKLLDQIGAESASRKAARIIDEWVDSN